MKTIIGVLLLCSLAFAQRPQVQPPQIDYKKYGSLSGQMIVYQNTQRRLNELELERYRRFMEEVRRNMPQQSIYIVNTRRESSYDCSYRMRREDNTCRQLRSNPVIYHQRLCER